MSLPPRQRDEQQQRAFLRQAELLRKNIFAWDAMLHSPRGEDWPSMLGRLNAAYHQACNLDRIGIDDASEHVVYVPRRCLANAQDVALFLSTRLEQQSSSSSGGGGDEGGKDVGGDGMRGRMDDDDDYDDDGSGIGGEKKHPRGDYGGEEPTSRLRRYEGRVAELASEFEDGMVRF